MMFEKTPHTEELDALGWRESRFGNHSFIYAQFVPLWLKEAIILADGIARVGNYQYSFSKDGTYVIRKPST